MKRFLLLLPFLFGPLFSQGIYGPTPARRVVTGTGVPSSGLCATSGDVGKVYIRKDAAAANSSFYTCDNTGASTYAWELGGGGGGGGGYTSLTQDGTTGQLVASKSFSGPGATACGGTTGAITVDLAADQRCEVGVLTGNITGVTFTHLKANEEFVMVFKQAAAGGPFTVTYGASVSNTACQIPPDANTVLSQSFQVQADGATIVATSCPVTSGVNNLVLYGSTGSAPGTTPGPSGIDCRTTDLAGIDCLTNSGNHHLLVTGLANPNDFSFVEYVDANGIQQRVAPVTTTVSTTCPVTDPGGASVFLYNNSAGACTFNLPDGVPNMQRIYRNATGKTGAITIAVTTNNQIDLGGTNGTLSTGTLVTAGAAGDEITLRCDVAHHWYADCGKNNNCTNN